MTFCINLLWKLGMWQLRFTISCESNWETESLVQVHMNWRCSCHMPNEKQILWNIELPFFISTPFSVSNSFCFFRCWFYFTMTDKISKIDNYIDNSFWNISFESIRSMMSKNSCPLAIRDRKNYIKVQHWIWIEFRSFDNTLILTKILEKFHWNLTGFFRLDAFSDECIV